MDLNSETRLFSAGTIQFQPSYNGSTISKNAALSNYRFRGAVYGLQLDGDGGSESTTGSFSVSRDGKVVIDGVALGQAVECSSGPVGACTRLAASC